MAASSPADTVPSNILILSNPRSGSSWLGSTMANSPFVDYRREPVLQSRLGRVPDAFASSAGLTADEQKSLRREIDLAFSNRTRPVVVVKEVTPLLIDDFLEAVDASVLYLQRHPLAVARSHVALGWLPSSRLVERAGVGARERRRLEQLWDTASDITRLVAYFAAVDASVRERLERVAAFTITYETLVAGELGGAALVFESLGIGAVELAEPLLDAGRTDEYGVGASRRSAPTHGITPESLEAAKRAWLAFAPTSYTHDADWVP